MGKHPHTCFGGGIGRRSEDSAHTWRSRLATNGLHAGSSPAQSTKLITKKRNMEEKKCYISLPITGRDIEKVKKKILKGLKFN